MATDIWPGVLDGVPSHWRLLRLRHFAEVRRGTADKTIVEGERLTHLIQYTDVYYKREQRSEQDYLVISVTDSEWRNARVRENDLLVTGSSETIDDIGHSTLLLEGLTDHVFGSDVICVRPQPGTVLPGYGKYLMENHIYLSRFTLLSRGVTRFRFSMDDFKNVMYALPPLDEQKAIAGYLDSETSRVDALIERKRRFIDLLGAKRATMVTQALTKGVDSNVDTKPSGIEWVEPIPQHWTMGRLKNLVTLVTSGSRGWAQYYSENGPLFLRITNLPQGAIGLLMTDVRHVDVPPGAEGARTQVRTGDVLISITAEMGAIAVVPQALGEAYVSQHVALARPKPEVNSRWLAYVLSSSIGCEHYETRLYGGTKIQLSLDDVRETPVPLAPSAERDRIAAYLDDETAKIDTVVKKTRRSIELLVEYRLALISAAVTGQIDIPGTETSEDVA